MWYMDKKKSRPDCLNINSCLTYAGNLSDTRVGWRNYLQYLQWLSCSGQEQKARHFDIMCRGWALGAKAFKKEILTSHAEDIEKWQGSGSQEARELYWENLLDQLLKEMGKNQVDIASEKKAAIWKVMIAYYLKTHTAVTNGWLSDKLNMGAVQGVSRYVSTFAKKQLYSKREYRKVTLHITT